MFSNTGKQISTASGGSGVINFGGIDLNVAGSAFNGLTQLDDLGDVTGEMEDAFDEITGHIGQAASDSSSLGFASGYLETKATNLGAAREVE